MTTLRRTDRCLVLELHGLVLRFWGEAFALHSLRGRPTSCATITRDDQTVTISILCARLLAALMLTDKCFLDKGEVIEFIYDLDEPDSASNVISVMISKLRRHLAPLGVSIVKKPWGVWSLEFTCTH